MPASIGLLAAAAYDTVARVPQRLVRNRELHLVLVEVELKRNAHEDRP